MNRFTCSLIALLLTLTGILAQNQYPIVLVHGFAGWGRDEALGLKYWGGIQGDIQEQLKAQGYTVYTAAVGPFSSNWDRACELYAQIKGGQVDYGINHANKHGHARFGRTFPGLYPQWGNTVNGKVNKIHLIGHSMGGQTIRMLAQMLAKGTKGAPVEESASTHALFAGGKDWVHSITTISTPNQGTILADGFSEIGDLVKTAVIGAFSVLGLTGSALEALYDPKLDQWGIVPKQSGESFSSYWNRIFSSSIFKPGFKDICIWSLSTSGVAEENSWVKTLSNVYYYSYATLDTHDARDLLLRQVQLPNVLTMLLPLQPLGTFVGGRYGPDHGFTTAWQPNDGVVPTTSMGKDSTGQAVTYSGTSQVGKWNQVAQFDHLDHLAVTGLTLHTQIMGIYRAHAKLLAGLPVSVSSTRRELVAAADNGASDVIMAVAALKLAANKVQTTDDLKSLCAKPQNQLAANYCTNMLNQSTRRLRG